MAVPPVITKSGGMQEVTVVPKGTKQVQFTRCRQVLVRGVRSVGAAYLVDYGADLVTIADSDIDLTGTRKGVAFNGRFAPWGTFLMQRMRLANMTSGDGLHFPAQTKPLVNGRIEDSVIENISDPDHVHADAIQLTGLSVGFSVDGLLIRNSPSAFQVTPIQNAAKDAGTGSGQSTGVGGHQDMKLVDVTLQRAGPARFFNCPRLKLHYWTADERSPVDLRRLQGMAGGVMPPDQSMATRDVELIGCNIAVLYVGGLPGEPLSAQKIHGGVTISPTSRGNKIGKLLGKDATPAMLKLLTRPF